MGLLTCVLKTQAQSLWPLPIDGSLSTVNLPFYLEGARFRSLALQLSD